MPTFDFRCGVCGSVFEHSRPLGSKVKPSCPSCRSKRIEKLFSPPAVHFRGSGFFKTDGVQKSPPALLKEQPKDTVPSPVVPTKGKAKTE